MKDAPPVVVRWYLPAHRWQRYVLQTPARDTAALAGIRGGKTVLGATRFLMDVCRGEPGVSLLSGPDLPMIRQTTLETIFRGMGPGRWGQWPACPRCKRLACPGSERWIGREQDPPRPRAGRDCEEQGSVVLAAPGGGLLAGDSTIRLRDGNQVLVRPGDRPDHLRGPAVKAAWVDEFTFCRPEMLPIVMGRTLDTQGRTLWTGTPKGKNWFWRDVLSQLPTIIPGHVWGDDRWCVVSWPTGENPGINAEDLASLAKRLSRQQVEQELEGKIVDWGGMLPFGLAVDHGLSLGSTHWRRPIAGHQVVVGVDPAGRGRDYWAVVVVCATCRCVVDLWRERKQESFRRMYDRTGDTVREWHAREVHVDETSMGGQAVFEELEAALQQSFHGVQVTGFTFTRRTKYELLSYAISRSEEGIGLGPDLADECGPLVQELRNYEWDDEAIETDCVMAYALAVRLLFPVGMVRSDLSMTPRTTPGLAPEAYRPVDWDQRPWR